MKFAVIFIISAVTILLSKEKWDKIHMSQPNFKASESFHMQWIGISILWFVAAVFFSASYINSLYKLPDTPNNNLIIAVMYFYIAIVYVIRGFSKDIMSPECLWTSKGKIKWSDVRSCKIIEDETSDLYIYVEVIANQKTVLMKFLNEERNDIEGFIEKVWC